MRGRRDLNFTIGTLVTDMTHYGEMRRSFEAGGFVAPRCDYAIIDNTGGVQTSAYAGLNKLLDEAQGQYIILCHQDVRLLEHDCDHLSRVLEDLERIDPTWAVAGNAGGVAPGRLAIRITDPHGEAVRVGALPARVATLDENFLVVKRSSRVGFSRDLEGFHFYGADICIGADILGYTAYVIDFHLNHLSAGRKSDDFQRCADAFRRKW